MAIPGEIKRVTKTESLLRVLWPKEKIFPDFLKSGKISFFEVKGRENHLYILDGKEGEVRLESEVHLHKGETVKLRAEQAKDQHWDLEILDRVFTKGNTSEKKELHNYKGTVSEFLRESHSKVAEGQIYSVLKTFFPSLNWSPEVFYSFWKIADSESEVYVKKDEKVSMLLLNYEGKKSGRLDFVFHWKNEKSDVLALNGFIHDELTYMFFIAEMEQFEKIFDSSGLSLESLRIEYKKEFSILNLDYTA